jgi:hypothetical protein
VELVRSLVESTFSYLREHPEELKRALKNAVALRFGLPMAAFRWALEHAPKSKLPRDLEIDAMPPGVRVAGSFELMRTPLRASAEIYVERVAAGPEELTVELRLANTELKLLDESVENPLSTLLRSGALDLSKPGNLVAYMPKRPAMLASAQGDRIVLDLMRHPKLASDRRLRRLLGVIAPLLRVEGIHTDDDHLDVALRAFPEGVAQAFSGVRRAF